MDRLLSFRTDMNGNIDLYDEFADVVYVTRAVSQDLTEDEFFDLEIDMLREAKQNQYR